MSSTSIEVSLAQHNAKDLLRFITCGNVDDGKSTLIGRLLLEAGAIYDDQIAALQNESEKHGTVGDRIDTALLLDGLEDERQQGITIDVAYRYFTTSNRKFIAYDAFRSASRALPTLPVYNPDGTFYQLTSGEIENPVARVSQITDTRRDNQFLLNTLRSRSLTKFIADPFN